MGIAVKKKIAIGIIIIVLSASLLTVGYYLANQTAPKPIPQPIQSLSNYYLPNSKILVVSANATYGNYPGPTVTTGPYPTESVIAESGEPCVIINVTLRNDYTIQNPAPNAIPYYNSTSTNIALTANLFSGETQINATDITNAFSLDSVFTNRAFTSLNYGESTILSIYLATNEMDITSFQLIPYYVSLAPPP